MTWLPYVAGAVVFALGIYGAIVSKHVVHQILCVSVAQSGTYVLLLTIGFRTGGAPPIYTSAPPSRLVAVDPLVQALALTDVVVSAATTALLLALAMKIKERGGSARANAQRAEEDGAT